MLCPKHGYGQVWKGCWGELLIKAVGIRHWKGFQVGSHHPEAEDEPRLENSGKEPQANYLTGTLRAEGMNVISTLC